MKNILKRIDGNIFIRNAIILSFVLAIFLAIDQITKIALFAKISSTDIDNNGFISNSHTTIGKIFGTRLVTNTGMFSSLGANSIPYWGVQTITSIVFLLIIIGSLLSKRLWTSFGFALMAAGAFGNILDRFMLIYIDTEGNYKHYVRDWIYHPNFDRGTYNIADVEVIIGSITVAISIIWGLFTEEKNGRNNKKSLNSKNR